MNRPIPLYHHQYPPGPESKLFILNEGQEPFSWGKGFERWETVRLSTIPDGSCLFHAIAAAFFPPYHSEIFSGKPTSKRALVASMRKELAKTLGQNVDPLDPTSATHYDLLARGYLSTFAESAPEFSLEAMQRELEDSSRHLGYGYIEYIGDRIKRDIFILNGGIEDVYITGDDDLLHKGRRAVVLLYHHHHYETVGITQGDGTLMTNFPADHPFILFLRSRFPSSL
jgi:hypothetical protein